MPTSTTSAPCPVSPRASASNSGTECGRMSRPTTTRFAPVKVAKARPMSSASASVSVSP